MEKSKEEIIKDLEGVIEHTKTASLTHQDNPTALAALAAMKKAAEHLMSLARPN
ncbi:hypothetical protein LCGC14_2152290 [marine sediment metagenome]|uniref:Uncharacterized protein n=1 Tax=marine sediment metagenome TaxID=412755 RepID=A0A0F9DV29_9ZZZZ